MYVFLKIKTGQLKIVNMYLINQLVIQNVNIHHLTLLGF